MIIVTGGSGFQGKPLCKTLLEKGKEVIDISLNLQESAAQVRLAVDIADRAALAEVFKRYPIEMVVHMASLLHTESWKNPDSAFETNVLGSVNLLNLCRQHNVPRLIFGSTVDAIGYIPLADCPVDETYDILPSDFYGETKRFIEKMGVAYAEQYGFEFVSARIPFLVGPGPASPTSAWRMDLFNLLPIGGGLQFGFPAEAVIPMVDIRDSAEAITVLALAKKPQHFIYHIPGESFQLENLAQEVQRIGSRVAVTYGDKPTDFYPPVVSYARFFEEFKTPPVSLVKRMQTYRQTGA